MAAFDRGRGNDPWTKQSRRLKERSGGSMKTFTANQYDAYRISILSVFTLMLWLGCLLVGGLGFIMHYPQPHSPSAQPPPVKVEMLEVKLTDDPQLTPESSHNSTVTDPVAHPQIPQPIAVAQPSPAIAFALPVKGPVRIVEASHAAYSQPSTPAPATPAPQPLTFGEGEGRQPAPEYPERARRAGQEGSVTVRFTVAEDGYITAAEVIEPCRWPLLNQSALHAVRERWRFVPGPIRIYDVPIHFQLRAK